MNYRMVFYVIGNMMKSEAALMLLAIIVALVYGEADTIVWFVIPMFIWYLLALYSAIKCRNPGIFMPERGLWWWRFHGLSCPFLAGCHSF